MLFTLVEVMTNNLPQPENFILNEVNLNYLNLSLKIQPKLDGASRNLV